MHQAIPTHIQNYFPVVYLVGFQLPSLYCRQKATLPNILDILYSKFWAATKGFNSFLPPTIIAWISPWKKRTHWARRIHGQRKWDRYHNSHRGYDQRVTQEATANWLLFPILDINLSLSNIGCVKTKLHGWCRCQARQGRWRSWRSCSYWWRDASLLS